MGIERPCDEPNANEMVFLNRLKTALERISPWVLESSLSWASADEKRIGMWLQAGIPGRQLRILLSQSASDNVILNPLSD